MHHARLLILFVLVLTCVNATAQTTVEDQSLGFSFELPEGWLPVPEEDVLAIEDQVRQASPEWTGRYLCAYSSTGFLGDYPRVVVQLNPAKLGKATLADIRRAFNVAELKDQVEESNQAFRESTDSEVDVRVGSSSLDTDRLAVLMGMEGTDAFGDPNVGISATMLGSQHMIQIVLFTTPEGPTPAELVEPMLDSFEWNPGYRFVPAKASASNRSGMSGSQRASKIASGISRLAIILVVLVPGAVFLLRKLVGRAKG